MVADNSRLAALAAFNPPDLLGFAMKLLNLPAPAAHVLNGWCPNLSHLIGDKIVPALGGQHNPEQFHFLLAWQSLQFDGFAAVAFLRRPEQAVQR